MHGIPRMERLDCLGGALQRGQHLSGEEYSGTQPPPLAKSTPSLSVPLQRGHSHVAALQPVDLDVDPRTSRGCAHRYASCIVTSSA